MEAAAIFGEQVAQDGTACLHVGFRADEDSAPARRRDMRSHQFATNDVGLAIVGEVFENLLLPGMIVGDGEGHQMIERQVAIAVDLHQPPLDPP